MLEMIPGTLVYDPEGNMCLIKESLPCECCVLIHRLSDECVEQRGKEFCKVVDGDSFLLDVKRIDSEISDLERLKDRTLKSVSDFVDENIDGFGIGEKLNILKKGDVYINGRDEIFVADENGNGCMRLNKNLLSCSLDTYSYISSARSITVDDLYEIFQKRVSDLDSKIKKLELNKQKMFDALEKVAK